jgi:GntR family transcriptional regulator
MNAHPMYRQIAEDLRQRIEVGERHRAGAMSPVRVTIMAAPVDIAARLRIPEGTAVISRHEQRYIDGSPYSLQTSLYPMTLADRGAERLCRAENITEGTVEYLRATLGIRQAGYRDWITVRQPDASAGGRCPVRWR